MRLRNSEPVGQFPIVFAIKDCKVGKLASLKRTDLVSTIETVGRINCRCCDGFCGRHFHVRAGERQNHHSSEDRKSTRLNSSHQIISYAVFCLKKKKIKMYIQVADQPRTPK